MLKSSSPIRAVVDIGTSSWPPLSIVAVPSIPSRSRVAHDESVSGGDTAINKWKRSTGGLGFNSDSSWLSIAK